MADLKLKNPQTQEERYIGNADINKSLIQDLQSQGFTETITGEALAPVPSLNFQSSEVSPPADISGLQPAELKLTPQEEKQTSFEKQLEEVRGQIEGRAAFEQEKRTEFGVTTAQQGLDDLNTQLRDLQRQQQLVPLAIQQQSVGRGRTEAGVEPLEIGRRRALAYDALATASFIDAAQGRLASAERKVTEAVNQKFAPLEAKEKNIMANLKMVQNSPLTSIQDKNRAAKQEAASKARTEANDKAKLEAKNILSWAVEATKNMVEKGEYTPEIVKEINRGAEAKTEAEALGIFAPYLVKKEKVKAEAPLSVLDVARYSELYPEAGVVAGDTEAQANAKVAAVSGGKTTAPIKTWDEFIDEVGKEIGFPALTPEVIDQLRKSYDAEVLKTKQSPEMEKEKAGIRSTIAALIEGDELENIIAKREQIIDKLFSSSKKVSRETISVIFDKLTQ